MFNVREGVSSGSPGVLPQVNYDSAFVKLSDSSASQRSVISVLEYTCNQTGIID